MIPEIQAYIFHFDYLHGEVKNAIKGMSTEELDWVPLAADTSSTCVMVTHMAGAESFRVREIVGGMDTGRDRDSEFVVRGSSVAELEALLDRTGEATRAVLEGLSSEDLDQIKVAAHPWEPPASARWNILHTIEHYGLHLGHISLTRQLYAAR